MALFSSSKRQGKLRLWIVIHRISGAPRARHLSICLVVTWPHVLPPVRPYLRATNVKSHTFLLLWEVATWCTPMLWSIDSCQNRVSAVQYYMIDRGLRCRPIVVGCFFLSYLSYYFSNDRRLNSKWISLQVCLKWIMNLLTGPEAPSPLA